MLCQITFPQHHLIHLSSPKHIDMISISNQKKSTPKQKITIIAQPFQQQQQIKSKYIHLPVVHQIQLLRLLLDPIYH